MDRGEPVWDRPLVIDACQNSNLDTVGPRVDRAVLRIGFDLVSLRHVRARDACSGSGAGEHAEQEREDNHRKGREREAQPAQNKTKDGR